MNTVMALKRTLRSLVLVVIIMIFLLEGDESTERCQVPDRGRNRANRRIA
jgi:hypothetical protein